MVIRQFFKGISNKARFLIFLWWLCLATQIWGLFFKFHVFPTIISLCIIISWFFLGIYNLRYKEVYLFER